MIPCFSDTPVWRVEYQLQVPGYPPAVTVRWVTSLAEAQEIYQRVKSRENPPEVYISKYERVSPTFLQPWRDPCAVPEK